MEIENEMIKEAFLKVKEDINFLNNEILNMKIQINDLRIMLDALSKKQENTANISSTIRQTDRQITSTDNTTSTHSSTVPQEIEGLKASNLSISIGNEGASTDRQTDRQTDNSTDIYKENKENNIESNIKEASEILDSLDNIKKEIRLKFKHLTSQEMSVFSTIYQLEGQDNKEITYKLLSEILKLSESSIRDYIQRMINKGISIKKQKINNKKILLSISKDLKKIASLPTIIRLREL